MKIGVLSNTLVPTALPTLPERVFEIFNGVDIILHAGDICDLQVLQQLEPVAQTYAVYGEQDNQLVRKYLQATQRLEFANRAIGLIHGHGAWEGNLIQRARYLFDRKAQLECLYTYVLSGFTDVHAIVFGHSREPYMKMHDGVLLFNPGSVAQLPGQPASVGILEIGANTIKGRIVPLQEY
ncbi:MAG: metallophosphoesterase family protein [Chloroflexi bacterium]|nr:metallophosphoesterase family protein [Chloroflexota bacterium]